jgi:hypothetical protein
MPDGWYSKLNYNLITDNPIDTAIIEITQIKMYIEQLFMVGDRTIDVASNILVYH